MMPNTEARTISEEDGHVLYNNYERIFLDEDNSAEAIFIRVYDAVSIYKRL